ncbi:hypothetical protein CHARACLAT_007324 [Characodon lateralis]|uniref:Ig-like domain-containing protein n=1 Tax=Characodon lateralis TaxID=208331 RepID=A0ABU7DF19_9TELE|nr:hypothetical protein [Characodon lateralis]
MARTERDLLLGLVIACFCSSFVTAECNGCNMTDCCIHLLNKTESDFKPRVNHSVTAVNEGDDVKLECTHNISESNLTYTWFKDNVKTGDSGKTYFMENVLSSKNGKYKCCVKTWCGDCESEPFDLKVANNSIVILVVCGVSAVALILIMGVAMKIKLKKDQAQHKERMRQRAQDTQNAGPIPLPRGY